MAAYPDHFLAADEDQPWLMGLRDRLRSKFVRAVLALGGALEADARWEDAIALYRRALELDNLAEDLYRSLMVCYRELGRPSEALQTYRRCRELLSVVLGLQPSPQTESGPAIARGAAAGSAARAVARPPAVGSQRSVHARAIVHRVATALIPTV